MEQTTKADLPSIDEETFQRAVISVAIENGWLVHETANAAVGLAAKAGRYDAVIGSGFPDLVLMKDSELLIIELKTERGRFDDSQENWLNGLRWIANNSPLLRVFTFRPRHWSLIVEYLET